VSFISDWDSGQPNGLWDVGLQWDVNVPSPGGDPTPYLNLVTSEHRNQPDFIAMLTAVLQPFADLQTVMSSFPSLYDIDVAAGVQEDAVGEWVGVSRDLNEPLTGIYFELDSATLGLDQGILQGPFDPTTGIVQLPDDVYRTLLKAVVLNNSWDGTVPGAYAIWNELFTGTTFGILIQDLSNMHMILAVTGAVPNPTILALFLSGDLNVRPDGVQIDYYMTPDDSADPYFGFDVESSVIAGLDVGGFGYLNNGTGY
jgi:Protein of unknown function (DUF2612)